jgi:hypothetical protein
VLSSIKFCPSSLTSHSAGVLSLAALTVTVDPLSRMPQPEHLSIQQLWQTNSANLLCTFNLSSALSTCTVEYSDRARSTSKTAKNSVPLTRTVKRHLLRPPKTPQDQQLNQLYFIRYTCSKPSVIYGTQSYPTIRETQRSSLPEVCELKEDHFFIHHIN